MPEPFKNWVNIKMIKAMSIHFKKHWPDFNDKSFIKSASQNFEQLELKARTERITLTMIDYFPSDFEAAADILLASLGTPLEHDLSAGNVDKNGISGWAVHSLTLYVALEGQDHFDLSMDLLREMTMRASSEFDIRPFLDRSPRKTLKVLKTWAQDDNHHVRRLASEGSRPRLPWGMKLHKFVDDPKPVIKVLELLKNDPEEYVRRSVANNLNDIAKDHPELVADLIEAWLKNAHKDQERMIRHACRSLIKDGHKRTLKALGYTKAKINKSKLTITTPKVTFGSHLQFAFEFESMTKKPQSLMIDYIVHHKKASGSTSPKVFKWKNIAVSGDKKQNFAKKHAMKAITTRVYYPGTHILEVVINGSSVAKKNFELVMK